MKRSIFSIVILAATALSSFVTGCEFQPSSQKIDGLIQAELMTPTTTPKNPIQPVDGKMVTSEESPQIDQIHFDPTKEFHCRSAGTVAYISIPKADGNIHYWSVIPYEPSRRWEEPRGICSYDASLETLTCTECLNYRRFNRDKTEPHICSSPRDGYTYGYIYDRDPFVVRVFPMLTEKGAAPFVRLLGFHKRSLKYRIVNDWIYFADHSPIVCEQWVD